MKVSNKVNTALLQNSKNDQKTSNKLNGKTLGKQAEVPSTQVELSPRARQIKKAKGMIDAESVNESKVAHFQNLIDGGKYKIDAAKVADRLVDEHLKIN